MLLLYEGTKRGEEWARGTTSETETKDFLAPSNPWGEFGVNVPALQSGSEWRRGGGGEPTQYYKQQSPTYEHTKPASCKMQLLETNLATVMKTECRKLRRRQKVGRPQQQQQRRRCIPTFLESMLVQLLDLYTNHKLNHAETLSYITFSFSFCPLRAHAAAVVVPHVAPYSWPSHHHHRPKKKMSAATLSGCCLACGRRFLTCLGVVVRIKYFVTRCLARIWEPFVSMLGSRVPCQGCGYEWCSRRTFFFRYPWPIHLAFDTV